jgi:hypothetical protein
MKGAGSQRLGEGLRGNDRQRDVLEDAYQRGLERMNT